MEALLEHEQAEAPMPEVEALLEKIEALPLTPESYGMTPDAIAALLAYADGRAALYGPPPKRRRAVEEEWLAAGRALKPVEASPANLAYAKRAAKLLALADSDPLCVATEVIGGTNTYAKALRAYRDGLLEALKGGAA